ncbi:hypothetical protein [Thermoflavimicrobium daqui]|nr:hypothetical protein [Thermoflavimicrobium daqui]
MKWFFLLLLKKKGLLGWLLSIAKWMLILYLILIILVIAFIVWIVKKIFS